MDILLGTALGTMIAFVLAIPAILLETSRRVKDLPLLIDVHLWHGKKLNEGEVFAIGLFVHLLVGALYGCLYVLFAEEGWLFVTNDPYSLQSLLVFAFFAWILVNVVVMPIIGVGVFGRFEGKGAWFETLVSLALEGLTLWVLVQFYQPYYFMI